MDYCTASHLYPSSPFPFLLLFSLSLCLRLLVFPYRSTIHEFLHHMHSHIFHQTFLAHFLYFYRNWILSSLCGVSHCTSKHHGPGSVTTLSIHWLLAETQSCSFLFYTSSPLNVKTHTHTRKEASVAISPDLSCPLLCKVARFSF